MKKKNIFTMLLTMVLAGAATVSCDDFLTETPRGEVTEANAFTSAEDAEALVVSCYDGIQKGFEEYYTWYYMVIGECLSDNAYSGGDDPDINNVGAREIDPLNQVVMKSWKSLYGGIMRCNVALKHIPGIPDAKLDEISFGETTRRQEMIGEASFLRALHYYNLVRTWGRVPLVTTTGSTAPEDVQVPRVDSETQIYDQILADLKVALDRLPEQRGTAATTRGLASKGAVNALYAQTYAIIGAPGNVDWGKVKSYCEAVTGSPVYSLVNEYDYLFDDEHRNNSETILAVQYEANTTENNYVPVLLLPPSMTDQNWRKYLTPSQDLIAAFDEAGDAVRKASTIVYENVNNVWFDQYYADNAGGSWNTGNLPFPYKTRAKNRVGWDCGDLVYIFRLADIVLLHAEAVNQTDGHTAAAADPNVVKIRTRAGLQPLAPTSKENMKNLLLDERRLELAYEGERWYDLKRYGMAKSTIDALQWEEVVKGEKVTVNGHLPAHMVLMPIPQDERDRNPKLTQNAGYNL